MIKILMMSDIHLGPEGRVKYGLDTAARFKQAVAEASRLHADADLCVFAGDLADLAEPAAYVLFDQLRSDLRMPQAVMIGNHDSRPAFIAHSRDVELDENGFVQAARDLDDVRVIMLDTTEPGRVEGILCNERLDWLAARLAEARAADLRVVLMMHHNPPRLHMPVDRYSLTEPDRLLKVLRDSKADILQIMAGHCHITSAGSWGGFPFATISGNQHRVEPFLRGRTGQQTCYEGTAQFAVILIDPQGCTVHFQNYVDRNIPLPDAMFPWKKDQAFL